MTNYSFTVTLKPRMYRYEPEQQYDETKNPLILLLRTISNNFTLMSERTQCHNIHYHGIIEMPSKRKWYSAFRNSDVFGFTCVREIYAMKPWIEYMKKDCEEFCKDLNRRPLIKDDYKICTSEEKAKIGTEW